MFSGFIRRPVATVMLNLGIVVFGVLGLLRLPVREIPDIDPAVVNVLTVYPGANAEVVETDPFEGGLRKILNFGHTIGHAVESLALNTDQPLLHGEATALGMMVEGMLSVSHCGLLQSQLQRIVAYLSEVYDDLDRDILLRKEEILSIAASDKKNKDGRLLFALLEDIGKATFDIPVSADDIVEALRQVYDQLGDN